MDRFITSHENYSIWQLSKNGLFDLAKFVVYENYKHHKNLSETSVVSNEEIEQIYNEEIRFFDYSKVFVARNDKHEIVGAIRIMKWNRKDELPITKLFGITTLNEISPKDSDQHIWHIGRFAVGSELGKYGILLFKILMMYAVAPICKYEQGIMFAECDSKLFKTVNLMGLKAIALDDGVEYLGSVTIPMYATRDGIMEFVTRNHSLASNVKQSLNKTQNVSLPFNEKISA